MARSGSRSRSASRGRTMSSRSGSRDSGLSRGRVASINQRGFGFLNVPGKDRDIWFHSNDIVGGDIDIRQFRQDDEVECKIVPSEKIRGNYVAVEVRPMDMDKVSRREMRGRRPSKGRSRRGRSP